MKKILTSLAMLCVWLGAMAQAATLHVSPGGSDTAPGTAAAPFATIQKAMAEVAPGGTILVHAGTYTISERIVVPEKSTTADQRIRLWAAGDGEVIVDGSAMQPKSQMEFKMARCMYFPYWANYWHVKGITFQNAKDNGVKVEGSYNIFENCVFRNNNDTGLQIGMFKDWSIEETKRFPISGTPEFNPGYTYCRGNKVINCDAYNNYDATSFGGTDNGGDADGFACKLFPGPGTEFYGCRAWNNSDDNWDLYMVYHPVVISDCWAWNAAIDANGQKTPGNGNGFKLGGGGSSGGAAFDQSAGAHVVRNCVSFNNTVKGFDQNNASEGMYLFNNVAWGNEFNYRFPTAFTFGGMRIRNCVGFLPRKLNHEFLSANKEGYVVPDTDFNSWTLIDGCDPVKDGNKVGKTKVFAADHSAEFLSLSEELAKAPRLPDGSLPENDFCRLKAGSIFVDKGEITDGFVPVRHMTPEFAARYGLELTTADPVTIEHNGAAPDLGAFESGQPSAGRLYTVSGQLEQTVYSGTEIEPIVLRWGGAATGVETAGLEQMGVATDPEAKTVTITGAPTANVEATVTTVGGETNASLSIRIEVSDVAPATLVCTTANQSQTVFRGRAIEPIVFERGGGSTAFELTGLPEGLESAIEGTVLTITGTPAAEGTYTVSATGGMTTLSLTGRIGVETPYKILTGDWYHIQDAYENIPADLQGVVEIESGANYTTVWDPTYKESAGVPAGCTEGAVNVERGGALVWNLPSVLELKANVHFTGGRYLEVRWKRPGEAEQSWTSAKMSKTTLAAWDILAAAGIEPTDGPITVKFVNPTSNNGGIRVYDFFVKVADNGGESGIGNVAAPAAEKPVWYATDAVIVIDSPAEIASAALYSLDGRLVSHTTMSGILPRRGAAAGVYILTVTDTSGRTLAAKIKL